MKKCWSHIVSGLLLFSVVAGSYAAASLADAREMQKEVTIDDKSSSYGSKAAIQNDVYILPLRMIHELANVELTWDNVHKRAEVKSQGKKYIITAGEKLVKTSADPVRLLTPAELRKGNIFVPATLLAEMSGAKVTLSEDNVAAAFTTANYYKMHPEGEPDITLLPMKIGEDDFIEGMKLKFSGKTYSFPDWRGMWGWNYKPEISTEDISGDGHKEIIVVNTLGYGTGVFNQEARVWNPVPRKEEKIDSLKKIVDENIESTIKAGKNQIQISLKIKGHKEPITQAINESNASELRLNDGLGFGAWERYMVSDGKLMMRASANYTNTSAAGELIVTYQYKDHRYQADEIKYEVLDE
ncbi:stalk domain-containing protein [Paenibacillus sp. An7]|uniref:stalk domain-containing protein n=1 Tax=Paenibacillus sp. An7 TaxID=2689577 RepID=UPI00135B98E2|nr:stalk domain-containing protein [Paenibacillus sp. An7]